MPNLFIKRRHIAPDERCDVSVGYHQCLTASALIIPSTLSTYLQNTVSTHNSSVLAAGGDNREDKYYNIIRNNRCPTSSISFPPTTFTRSFKSSDLILRRLLIITLIYLSGNIITPITICTASCVTPPLSYQGFTFYLGQDHIGDNMGCSSFPTSLAGGYVSPSTPVVSPTWTTLISQCLSTPNCQAVSLTDSLQAASAGSINLGTLTSLLGGAGSTSGGSTSSSSVTWCFKSSGMPLYTPFVISDQMQLQKASSAPYLQAPPCLGIYVLQRQQPQQQQQPDIIPPITSLSGGGIISIPSTTSAYSPTTGPDNSSPYSSSSSSPSSPSSSTSLPPAAPALNTASSPSTRLYSSSSTLSSASTPLQSPSTLLSPNGLFLMTMQSDGNLVLSYAADQSVAFWASNSYHPGFGPYSLSMQADGNLVIYDAYSTPLWASGSYGKGIAPYSLKIQASIDCYLENKHELFLTWLHDVDDGNLVIYDASNQATWASRTAIRPTAMSPVLSTVSSPAPQPSPVPSPAPQPSPVPSPSPQPSPIPSPIPQPSPVPSPSPQPSPIPSPVPQPSPVPSPSPQPSPVPSPVPQPSPVPSPVPQSSPVPSPVPQPQAYSGTCPCDDGGLCETNLKRSINSAPPLTWSTSLATSAQNWANYLAANCLFQHSGTPGVGENLLGVYASYPEASLTWCSAVDDWYSEISNYQFTSTPYTTNEPHFESIGHFTQLVWVSTSTMGCGMAQGTCSGADPYATIVVCQYSSPGNIESDAQFLQNVLPPSS
ncbi:hypothetical protein CEUSTIGMA_g12996.t1 [Chlamydomonas eustigma]|uniref:Bulb-type lectin domain-containing protein n=1 Tax=Chlamydomonas eustigma TaxID=1157962 RepID=A0A250XR68_9CHLO|nr:hypothetical protein CEUSTIGMA_g12996.t1 [Chlamydomonas eustigma]|eukprot:GAX85581.1 hypothetical protein CEUSTIGMA_g12996.t1 [Chlamydomonas eustigma]